jgi:hypothetical protein
MVGEKSGNLKYFKPFLNLSPNLKDHLNSELQTNLKYSFT